MRDAANFMGEAIAYGSPRVRGALAWATLHAARLRLLQALCYASAVRAASSCFCKE